MFFYDSKNQTYSDIIKSRVSHLQALVDRYIFSLTSNYQVDLSQSKALSPKPRKLQASLKIRVSP